MKQKAAPLPIPLPIPLPLYVYISHKQYITILKYI
jgi:hypothetical protein